MNFIRKPDANLISDANSAAFAYLQHENMDSAMMWINTILYTKYKFLEKKHPSMNDATLAEILNSGKLLFLITFEVRYPRMISVLCNVVRKSLSDINVIYETTATVVLRYMKMFRQNKVIIYNCDYIAS